MQTMQVASALAQTETDPTQQTVELLESVSSYFDAVATLVTSIANSSNATIPPMVSVTVHLRICTLSDNAVLKKIMCHFTRYSYTKLVQ